MLTHIIATLALSDPGKLRGQDLLDDLSKRAVNYFWVEAHPKTGFTLDRAPNYKDKTEFDVSSIAAIGYGLAAYTIGAERGWIDKAEAKARTILTLKNIPNIEGHKGWFYHFVNWETGKRVWNSELSSIDSALMFTGMIMADSYWNDPEITKLTNAILDKVDWTWMLTDGGALGNSLTFTMGWKPEDGFIPARWNGFYEHLYLSIIAMGHSDAVPSNSWAAFQRGPKYTYKGIEFIHGAALFIHQMPQAYLDFRNRRDYLGYDYWVSGRNATLANRAYCIDNPEKFKGYGPDIWGLSACDIPGGYGAPGAPGAIFDNGTLAPAAAVAAVMYEPELAKRAAEAFVREYPHSYGRYGFTTGINPSKNWHSPDVIGIDIGQMLLAIENARDGKPWSWMDRHPIVRRGMAKAGFRNTDEGKITERRLYVPPVEIPPLPARPE
ncbi:MAG: hypothetical protein MUC92_09495 [Fimbriimonadaceae bacterium]|jgi:hypothetical protein|nr:hypothetical protein [Fimbriimonadaceae bacterium]